LELFGVRVPEWKNTPFGAEPYVSPCRSESEIKNSAIDNALVKDELASFTVPPTLSPKTAACSRPNLDFCDETLPVLERARDHHDDAALHERVAELTG